MRQSAGGSGAMLRRSGRAQAILARHFGFPPKVVKGYFTQAARREGRKVTEIGNAVISFACDLF